MLFPKASAGRQVCLPRNFWHFWRIWSRIFWRICSRVLHAHQPFCSSLHIDGVSTENFFVRDVGSTTGLASSSDATRLYEVVSHGQVQADLDADRHESYNQDLIVMSVIDKVWAEVAECKLACGTKNEFIRELEVRIQLLERRMDAMQEPNSEVSVSV
jgi:hypothetical protein